MAIWNNYVNALFKLKVFTKGGCIFWTFVALMTTSFNLAMEYKYNSEIQPFQMMEILMITEGGLNMIMMVLIPKSIFELSQYAEAEKDEDLVVPSKLALAHGISCVILIFLAGCYTVFGDIGVYFLVIVNLFFILYLLALGLLIGTLTNTLSTRFRKIENHGAIYEEATTLLEKYRSLNESCTFGLFPLFTCSVLIVIVLLYMFIIIMLFNCLAEYRTPISLTFIAAKTIVYIANLLHLAWTLDNCYENFKRISVPLR